MEASKGSSSLSADLNSFVYGVSKRNFQNAPELTKTGIGLLRNFPAAREAVLEYFSSVFRDAVGYCINPPDYEDNLQSHPSMEAVILVGTELCNTTESWASIVAPWCIGLLKDIATELSSKCVNTLQSLEAVRILLEIATSNLTKLKETERAQCIDTLLTHRQCEWVVGCVGRCDPWLVVPRVVALGVRDDARNNIDHVVATLGHLSTVHTGHIRDALLDLFYESLNEKSKLDRKNDIIPYLLHLATKSDAVLKALSNNIENILTEKIVAKVIKVASSLIRTPAWESVNPSQLVTLCLRAQPQLFQLLLNYAPKYIFARQLLEYLLQRMESEMRSMDRKVPLLEYMSDDTTYLKDKVLHGTQLEQYSCARVLILIGNMIPVELVNTITFMLIYSTTDQNLALLVRILSGVMSMETPLDPSEISMDSEKVQGRVTQGVENALNEAVQSDYKLKKCFIVNGKSEENEIHTYLQRLCLNLTKLLRWELTNKVLHLRSKPFSKACDSALLNFANAFEDRVDLMRRKLPCTMSCLPCLPTCHAMAEMIDIVERNCVRTNPKSVDVMLKLLRASTKYFFRCLHENDKVDQFIGVARALKLLRANRTVSHTNSPNVGVSRAMALRSLLPPALIRETKLLKAQPFLQEQNNSVDSSNDELLIYNNNKQGPITQLAQSHTSVFHAGIIGKGAKKSSDVITYNDIPCRTSQEIELLMGAILACMDGNGGIIEGMTSVSLLLVELISPDVMYNGLPWPDEDFTKVSIERELHTRSALERSNTARCALRMCAQYRPSLCLASALLRALAATALHQHNADSRRDIDTVERHKLDSITMELLEIMCLGQLLPHPLNYAQLIIPHLNSSEVVQILRDCIWNYTRDHVPSPALFTCDSTGLHWRDPATSRPPTAYTDTLRIIIQKNISQLGHLYPMMFLQTNNV